MLALAIAAVMLLVAVPVVGDYQAQRLLREPVERLADQIARARDLALRENRAYTIELHPDSFTLQPANPRRDEPPHLAIGHLAPRQRLFLKAWGESRWREARNFRWEFVAGRLCEPIALRFQRGEAVIEQTYSPLTGGVLSETSSMP